MRKIILILLAVMTGCSNSKESNYYSHKNEHQISNTEVYIISQNFVKDYLLSQSSADFPYESNVKFKYINNYVVQSYADFKNGYGVELRENK